MATGWSGESQEREGGEGSLEEDEV